jgi:hypothetical protein
MLKFNKRGQVGQTLTWVVATLIIVGVLIFSIIFSVTLAGIKDWSGKKIWGTVGSDLNENSQILETKTILAYELNSENKEQIEEILKNDK